MNCIDMRDLSFWVVEKLRIAEKEMEMENPVDIDGMRQPQDEVRLALINKTNTSALNDVKARPFKIAFFELGEE